MSDSDEEEGWTETAAQADEGEERNVLAETRTKMAEDRTVLANERTFAGWMRTGLASVGIGLAFNALFVSMNPWWVPRSIATVFFLIAILVLLSAERRACKVIGRLHAHKVESVGIGRIRIIAIASSAAVVALIAALWLLPVGR